MQSSLAHWSSVQVSLQSLPILEQNTPAQLGVIYKQTEGALNPHIQITRKDVEQDQAQTWALGNTGSGEYTDNTQVIGYCLYTLKQLVSP